MKQLIRNKATLEFLKTDGTWTRDASDAWDFTDMRSVVVTRRKYNLQDVELLRLNGDRLSTQDVVLPLGSGSSKRSSVAGRFWSACAGLDYAGQTVRR